MLKDEKYRLVTAKYKEFFWPTLAMSMANNVSVFVDSVLVSSFLGADRMTSIQLCYPMDAFINMAYWMLGLGGSLLASNYAADHDKETANHVFSVSMFTVLFVACLTAVFGNLFMPQLSVILCKDEMLRGDVMEYGRVMLAGMPVISFIMSLSYFARGDGKPNIGFWAVLIANGVNLVMDTVLMKIFGMELRGAATATIIGNICGLFFMFRYLFGKDRQLKFTNPFKGSRFFRELISISALGFPVAISQLYMMIKVNSLNSMVITYGGLVCLESFTIYTNSLFLVSIIIIGTAQTLSPIVSVYAHEGDYDRARYILRRSLKIALLGACAVGLLFALFPRIILTLYNITDTGSVVECKESIRMFVFAYPGLAYFYLMVYYFQAIEKERLTAALTILEGLILPVVFMEMLAPKYGHEGIWYAVVACETVSALMIVLFLFIAPRIKKKYANTTFLLPDQVDPDKYEFTVSMNIPEAVKLSHEAEKWVCSRLDHFIANKTCLALEEMLTGIVIACGASDDKIDVTLRREDRNIVISIRDMSKGFNPTIRDEGLDLAYDNVEVLSRIASEIKYDRSIGMNLTLIRIDPSVNADVITAGP